jgi:hypothetical protein
MRAHVSDHDTDYVNVVFKTADWQRLAEMAGLCAEKEE